MHKLFRVLTAIGIISTLVAACSSDDPTATPVPSTDLPVLTATIATPTDAPATESPPTATPAPLTAERLVNECAQAMGGIEKIEALETLHLAQRWPDHAGLIRYEIKRPNYVKMGDELAFDGERAFWLNGALVPQEEWKDFEMDIAWYVPAFFDYPAEYVGTEMVDDIETYKLEVLLPLGAVMTYNLDARTYLVYRASSSVTVGDQEYHYERTYSDYRWLDGILYPHAFTYASRDGREVLTATMRKLEFNVPLEEERFAVPAVETPKSSLAIAPDTLDQVELLHTISGFDGRVYGLDFSSDGALLASGSSDGAIRLWSVGDWQEVRTFNEEGFWRVMFSPDDALVTAENGKIWDVASGQRVHNVDANSRGVVFVAFAPDGALLASGGFDAPINIWSIGDWQLVRSFAGPGDHVFNLAFSPDGKLLAAGTGMGPTDVSDFAVWLWDVESGQELHVLRGHQGDVHAIAFSPDGALLASASTDMTVRVWDVQSGEVVHVLRHRDGLYDVTFSPDGAILATACVERAVRLWDVQSGRALRSLPHHDEMQAVAFAPDGSLLAAGGYDNQVYVWGLPRTADPALKDAAEVAFTRSAQTLGDSRSFGVAIADVDLDDDNDIFFPNYVGPSKLWLNDGNGVFTDSRQRFNVSEAHDAALGDFNGDTWPDIFLLSHATPSKVYFNDGAGRFRDSGQNIGAATDHPGTIVLGDVDNDGDADAFISYPSKPNRLWLNDGNGFFTLTDTQFGGHKSYDMALADFNGDAFLDLFLTVNDQADQVWLNDGAGNLVNSGQALVGSQAGDDKVASADLDGDGDNDVVVANNVEGIQVWLNQDNTGVFVAAGPYFGDSAWRAELCDVDLDGDVDLITAHPEGGNELWLNDGLGSFTSLGPIFGDEGVLSVACGKLDADDAYDVVLGKIEGSGGNTLYFNE